METIQTVPAVPAVEKLKSYLQALESSERDVLWLWLDGNPDAIHEMIEWVATGEMTQVNKGKVE